MHEWCFFPYIHIARQNVVLSLNLIKRLQKSKCSLFQSCQSNYNNIIIFLSNEDQYIEFCKCNWNKLSIPGRVLCFQSTAMSIDLNHFPKKRSYIYIYIASFIIQNFNGHVYTLLQLKVWIQKMSLWIMRLDLQLFLLRLIGWKPPSFKQWMFFETVQQMSRSRLKEGQVFIEQIMVMSYHHSYRRSII